MKRRLLLFIVFLLISLPVRAQTTFDTLTYHAVNRSVHYFDIAGKPGPWSIHVVEVNLKDSLIDIAAAKAGEQIDGLEKTSVMVNHWSEKGHHVLAAINGDFYSDNGIPLGTQVCNGEIIRNDPHHVILGFDNYNHPMLDRTRYTGYLIHEKDTIYIQGVNKNRGKNQLILYNHYRGATTGTNRYGMEIRLNVLDPWLVNDTVRCIIQQKVNGRGNLPLSPNHPVLSAHGTMVSNLKNLKSGDTVKIVNRLEPGLLHIKEALGGNRKIIDRGIKRGNWPEQHPRTAAGISRDSTRLYLVAVDGRQPNSVGMSLTELADFMLKLGIYNAINLDGGGSTTMVVNGKIVNSPADPIGERKVSNALLIISKH